jgi:hypothetical protein
LHGIDEVEEVHVHASAGWLFGPMGNLAGEPRQIVAMARRCREGTQEAGL